MAPSESKIIAALEAKVHEVFNGPNRAEELTVKRIRAQVESDLGLEEGDLQSDELKEKVKTTIRTLAEKLLDEEENPPPTPKAKPKNAAPVAKKPAPERKLTKRAAAPTKAKAPPKKRQKKQETPSEDEDEDISEPSESTAEESELSDFDDSDASEVQKGKNESVKGKAKEDAESEEEALSTDDDSEGNSKKRKRASKPVQKKSAKTTKSKETVESEDDAEDESKPVPKKAKSTPKEKPVTSKGHRRSKTDDSESSLSDKFGGPTADSGGEPSFPKKGTHKSSFTQAPSLSKTATKPSAPEDSESEMSIVLDEPQKPKRKKGEPKPKGEPKTAKPPKPKASEKDLSPDEATIKTLQSQLSKCGIRKIWPFELKQYGDDNKAKIKHLSNALKEVGMSGRFSESRAREIKEMRELMADVEAVKEAEKNWGVEGGRRSRATAVKGRKNLREGSGSADEENGAEGKDESEDEDVQPAAGRPRPRAALDWLGDEEDSDE